MPNCGNISNTQAVTLSADNLPEGFCHTSLQGTHNTFVANTTAQLLGNVAAFTAGDTTPVVEDRVKLWFELNNQCKPGGWKWWNPTTAAWEYVEITKVQAPTLEMPPGLVMAYVGSAAPSGWLMCHGGTVNRVAYAGLFAVIGTTYGTGDGINSFGIPDLRGEFIRGFDAGKGVDAGRAIATSQASSNLAHSHRPLFDGVFYSTQMVEAYGINHNSNSDHGGGGQYTGRRAMTLEDSGGTESRPRNVAMNYIIKH